MNRHQCDDSSDIYGNKIAMIIGSIAGLGVSNNVVLDDAGKRGNQPIDPKARQKLLGHHEIIGQKEDWNKRID